MVVSNSAFSLTFTTQTSSKNSFVPIVYYFLEEEGWRGREREREVKIGRGENERADEERGKEREREEEVQR